MELTAGTPFFLINDGLLHHYPKLLEHTKSPITIIGGGISGTLTAYQLIKAGIECVLVDSRSIGLGSTCASTSLLQYELDTSLHQLIERSGKENAVRAYQVCAEAIEKLLSIMRETGYTDYENNQSLLFSTHRREKKFMNREYDARKEAGFSVELLSQQEMKDRFGLQAHYGILSMTGATMNTYSLTHHLLQYCLQKGLRVYDRTRVVHIKDDHHEITLTTAEGFTIRSSYVVNATGYEVVNFIDKNIVNFDCTYAIVSEHQAEREQLWRDRVMLWNTDDPYLYMRLTKDNRLLAGGRDEPFSNKVTRHLFLGNRAIQLEKDVKKVLPGISFKTEFAWSGTFGKTKDSLPYIGPYHKNPRVFYALGFGGNGITFSQVAAELICDLLQGKKNPDTQLFSFDR